MCLPSSSAADRSALSESLQQVHRFLQYYSPADFRLRCWELLQTALGSEEADTWNGMERSNMLFFYQEACLLAEALPIIDSLANKCMSEE